MGNAEKMIKCSKCGATIKESQAYCNYCGSINILGAEIDYFNKLEDVRADLSEMGDDSEEEFKKTLKSGTKFVIIAIIAVALIVLIAFIIHLVAEKIDERNYQLSYNERQAVYAELNEMYEAGDFDGIAKYYEENGSKYQIYDWEHAKLVSIYQRKSWFEEDVRWYEDALEKSNSDLENSKSWVYYDSIGLMYLYERDNQDSTNLLKLSKEESEIAKEWAFDVKERAIEITGITEAEWNEMYDDYSASGEVWSIDDFRDYLKTRQ